MILGDKYRFKISVPTLGIVEVFPVNDSLTWKFTKGDQVASFVKELDTTLTFVDDTGSSVGPLHPRQDFTYIYDIERAKNRCFRIQLFIEKRCDDISPFVPYWDGFFTVADCVFAVEKCRVDAKISVEDGTRCFLDNWDEPINLVAGPSDFTPSIQQGFGTLPQKTCGDLDETVINAPMGSFPTLADALVYAQDCDDVGDPGWTILEHHGVFGGVENGNPWAIQTIWIRELANSVGMPTDNNGNPWTEISPDIWVRVPLLHVVFPYQEGYINPALPESWEFRVIYETVTLSGNDVQKLDNGRYLNTLLDIYFSEICTGYELRSNFFGLNPDGTEPTSDIYTAAANDLHELVLMPTHDIVKTDETTPSFLIDDWSLKDLIADLTNTFNLVFFYDYIVDAWRLEHFTYLIGGTNLDLTQPLLQKYISGKWNYTYEKGKIPKSEVFFWPVPTETDKNINAEDKNYDGYPIDYSPSNCLILNPSEELINVQIYLTDLFFILNDHKDPITGVSTQTDSIFYGTTRFVLLSTTSGRINVAASCLGSGAGLNIRLGWPCLHNEYWKVDRYLPIGTMNRVQTNFTRVKASRSQVPITLNMCCEEFDASYLPQDLVKTQLGWGETEEATYEEPSERLTLNLKHD